jgi:anti-sigma regulatory factor (Ser/Thr protein kinase)
MQNTTSSNISQACDQVFEETCSQYINGESRTIVMSHKGSFSQDLINSLSEGIEEILISNGEKKQLIKRVFSIVIEGLQNIRFHGENHKEIGQFGLMIVARGENSYKIFFGDFINNTDIDFLNEKLTKLNAMTQEELKSKYMEVLTNGIISNKGGAGLGFITIIMKAKSKLNFKFHRFSDEISLFSAEVDVLKES